MKGSDAASVFRDRALLETGLAAVLAVASLSACGEGGRPNVLLVTVDTLRADHLGCYGHGRPTSPVLDALASEGTLFERAYVPTPTTAPAHASLLTGLYPAETGAVKNGAPLAAGARTLAEVLAAEGYATAAVVSSFVLDRRFGWSRGFGSYDSRFEASASTLKHVDIPGFEAGEGIDQRADRATDKALAWLRSGAARAPFFLWVHYFDPHGPYLPPERFAALFPPQGKSALAAAVAAYDAEIRFADAEIGRLLAGLSARGLEDDTLVVVTADHGEGLQQHGFMGHGLQLYEEAVRVPLLTRLPGRVAAGGRIPVPVSVMDVMPTVLELCGAAPASGLRGHSLVPWLEGRPGRPGDRPIFLQRRPHEQTRRAGFEVRGDKSAVVVGPWKYIEAPAEGTWELYDLSADPGEERDLFAAAPERAAGLRRTLHRWDARIDVEAAVHVERAEVLRTLGYAE